MHERQDEIAFSSAIRIAPFQEYRGFVAIFEKRATRFNSAATPQRWRKSQARKQVNQGGLENAKGCAALESWIMRRWFVVPVLFLMLSGAQASDTDSQEADGLYDGLAAQFRGDYERALSIFDRLARQGDRVAQVNLGQMYEDGLGVPKDSERATELYRKAWEQGDFHAEFKLMYAKGARVPEEAAKAAAWYRSAAEQGFAHAMYELGSMYLEGKGMPEDEDQALEWFHKAAELGHGWGRFQAGYMYFRGPGRLEDRAEVVRWYLKGAERGYTNAIYPLGLLYARGDGVPEDDAEAIRWQRIGAEKGYSMSQFALALMYESGEGVPVDDAQAAHWFHKAAEQGYAPAQIKLGWKYFVGRGVPENAIEAYAWFGLSAASDWTGEHEKEMVAETLTEQQLTEADELLNEYLGKYSGR